MKFKLGTKTYISKDLTFKTLRKATELGEWLNTVDHQRSEEYDKLSEFAIELFGNQFTIEEIDEKLPLKNSLSVLFKIMNDVQNEAFGVLETKNEPAPGEPVKK